MYRIVSITWITAVILELIHANSPDLRERALLLDQNQPGFAQSNLVILNNFLLIVWLNADDVSVQGVPYQLSIVA